MTDSFGSLVCFEEETRRPVDRNLGWDEVDKGRHTDCGHKVAIESDFFQAHDLSEQQRIWDDGIRWKFYPPAETDETIRLKRLPRPWAEGEIIDMLSGSNG